MNKISNFLIWKYDVMSELRSTTINLHIQSTNRSNFQHKNIFISFTNRGLNLSTNIKKVYYISKKSNSVRC